MRFSFAFFIVLVSAASAYQRFEFALVFNVSKVDGTYVGVATSQSHISLADGPSLCYTVTSDLARSSPRALFRTQTFANGNSFSAKGNVTFGNGARIYYESPLAGSEYEWPGHPTFFVSTIPYQIVNGDGPFQGAVGAAATVGYGDHSTGWFLVNMIGVFFVRSSASAKPAPAFAPELEMAGWKKMQTKDASDCVHPREVIAGLAVRKLVTTFVSTPDGNVNHARGPNQVTFTDSENGASSIFALDDETPFRYDSVVASPTNTTFNETGTIRLSGSQTAFDFASSTDGTVSSFTEGNFSISFGSISYRISNGRGNLDGAFGSMVDVFTSVEGEKTFPIFVFAVLFNEGRT